MKSELNNSHTTSSMKDKPKNVKTNSLSDKMKSMKPMLPSKKELKLSMDSNKNKLEPKKILESPKNN